eukprot:gb/GECH01007057.1/.p1 GENE.gb/GECH01007057.1/~~gb/GECH01007057.1/.p1  ORF type:complete len:123 (+),score=20.48 gb/GECH01007057.1/:1-369(+)
MPKGRDTLETTALFTLNVDFISPECSVNRAGFETKWGATIALPFVFLFMFFIFYCVLRLQTTFSKRWGNYIPLQRVGKIQIQQLKEAEENISPKLLHGFRDYLEKQIKKQKLSLKRRMLSLR